MLYLTVRAVCVQNEQNHIGADLSQVYRSLLPFMKSLGSLHCPQEFAIGPFLSKMNPIHIVAPSILI